MTPFVKDDDRRGPLYRRTRTDGVLPGVWHDGGDSVTTPVELIYGNESPDRVPGGYEGYCLSSPGTLDTSWVGTRHYEPGIDPESSRAWVVDVKRYSLLQWMSELSDHLSRVLLDLRGSGKSLLYHHLPVRGWIQREQMAEPPATFPYKQPEAKQGSGPIFMLVHGFTGDPVNWSLVTDRMEDGPWPYVLPLLPGHGQPRRALANVRHEEWHDAVHQCALELKDEGRPLIGLGLSMGGCLLLQSHSLFDAITVINPPWSLHDWRPPLIPVLKYFKKHHFSETGGKVTPVEGIHELYKLLKQIRGTVSDVDIPTLVISHRDDEVVPPADARKYASALPNGEHEILESGGHESPADPEALPGIMKTLRNWLGETNLDVPSLQDL